MQNRECSQLNRLHRWLWLLLLLGCTPPTAPLRSGAPPVLPTATPRPAPSQRGADGTLHLVYHEAPSILNPHLASGIKDLDASRIVYEPLASLDAAGDLVPILADYVPSQANGGIATDGSAVTWRLKSGLRWSDGQPFSADDVRFTFAYVSNPDVQATSAGVYANVRSVEVIDPLTVRVSFKEPTAGVLLPFVGRSGAILPQHIFAAFNGKNAQQAPANLQPVGTGPYRIVGGIKPQEVLFLGNRLVKTNKIVFEPNPYFRDPDKPAFSRVELRGGGTVEQAFRVVLDEGAADYAWSIVLTETQRLEAEARGFGKVQANRGGGVLLIPLNLSDPAQGSVPGLPNPVLSDKRVRQAIAATIDRDRIVREVYGGSTVPETNYVIKPGAAPSPAHYPFDLARARALLDEAGWIDSDGDGVRERDGRPLELRFRIAISFEFRQAQQIIRENLERVGFRVNIDYQDPSVFFGSSANPDSSARFLADLSLYNWFYDSYDPVSMLSYWICDAIPRPDNNWSGANYIRWCNPAFDQLYQQAQATLDPVRRAALVQQMNDMLIDDAGLIVVAQAVQRSAVRNTLAGVELTPWDSDTWKIMNWRTSAP